jgi:hypothetical protein
VSTEHKEIRVSHRFSASAERVYDAFLDLLDLSDENACKEDEVYAELAARWTAIARQVREAAAFMEAQRALPMGAHDESAWDQDNLQAFAKFVHAQGQALALMRIAQEHDERMLRSMQTG